MALPDPGMAIDRGRTALLITDPQNDFLSEDGVTWGVVGESVTENNTVENIETLLKTAKENEIAVFISPHYYYPTDHEWKFEGALEALMHQINMFDRKGPLSLEGFTGSGADWLERYKEHIEDGKDRHREPTQGVRASEQRSRAATPETWDRESHSRWHVGQPVRGIAHARTIGTGI